MKNRDNVNLLTIFEKIKHNLTFLGFVIFFILILIFVTLIIVAFIKGNVYPQPIPEGWWSALAVVVTLSLGILVLNFVREEDYKEFRKKMVSFDERIKHIGELATLSTILLDIASEENKNYDKWNQSLKKIKKLYKLGFITDDDLKKISLAAWNQGEIPTAFEMRYFAFQRNSKNLENFLNVISILPFLTEEELKSIKSSRFKRLLFDKKLLLRELSFNYDDNLNKLNTDEFINKYKPEFKDEAFAYAVTGRIFYKMKKYEECLAFYIKATEVNNKNQQLFKRWHYQYILTCYLALGKIDDFEKLFIKIRNHESWYEDLRYLGLLELYDKLLLLIKNKPETPFKKTILIRGYSSEKRLTTWNLAEIIKNLFKPQVNSTEAEKKALELKEKKALSYYLDFYIVFGKRDFDYEEKFTIKLNEQKQQYFENLI